MSDLDKLIERLAREAGHTTMFPEAMKRFARVVAEDCARLCVQRWDIAGSYISREFAAEIRERFGVKP